MAVGVDEQDEVGVLVSVVLAVMVDVAVDVPVCSDVGDADGGGGNKMG